ncbi:hypothetical protein [Aureimonas sp. N4]|uniref:hypothetical protein n=1 Tax=Aureimonas sp. N4 TaxID=1638165 RepID=UPI0007837229|nr:hypothetical protein [Aureimonas sp. N4]
MQRNKLGRRFDRGRFLFRVEAYESCSDFEDDFAKKKETGSISLVNLPCVICPHRASQEDVNVEFTLLASVATACLGASALVWIARSRMETARVAVRARKARR